MELPKNITQIGESDRSCKVYVEDYVISYIKQMNHLAESKQIAVALYGTSRKENEISYQFFYGACKLDFLQKEVKHLSQAQEQEVERLRKKYFKDYQFLGYRLLNGEMVEGFHVYDQGSCRYIKGYACFYEKNDAMLAYMLDTRPEESVPEEFDQEKYDRVKQRQEERRLRHEEESGRKSGKRDSREEARGGVEPPWTGKTGDVEQTISAERAARAERAVRTDRTVRAERAAKARSGRKETSSPASSRTMRIMRGSVVGLFALLCIVGLTTMNGFGKMEQLQVAARQLLDEFTEKKIPDAGEALDVMNQGGQADTLVTEDKLADAIQKENAAGSNGGEGSGGENSDSQEAAGQDGQEGTGQNDQEGTGQNGQEGTEQNDQEGTGQNDQEGTGQNGQEGTGQIGQEAAGQNGQEGTGQSGQQGAGQEGAQNGAGENGDAAAGSGLNDQAAHGQDGNETPANTQPKQPSSYTIQKGDTLIGISIRNYGSDSRVKDICEMNDITNPDNIRIGQKILLP